MANTSYRAGADLSAKQYYVAKKDSSGYAVLAAGATDEIIGVIQDPGKGSGTAVGVAEIGQKGAGEQDPKVICGGTVAIGDRLTSDANGKAIATTTASNKVIGTAKEAGASNAIVRYSPPPGFAAQ